MCVSSRAVGATAYRFLLVDDDDDARFLMKRALVGAFPGCTVIEADGCASAVRAVVGARLDAVLSDHHLRGEEGTTCVQLLKQNGVTCPIIMVTGSENPTVHAAAYAAGVTRVFSGARTEVVDYLGTILRQ